MSIEKPFYCVANMRIIRDGRCPVNNNYQDIAILEVHEKNQYESEEQAVGVAESLAQRYTSEFFVLKAVKCVRRERHPVEVIDLDPPSVKKKKNAET